MPSDIADPVLAALLDELTDVNERLQRYLAGGLVLAAPPAAIWPAMADDPELISVEAAAVRARSSPRTIRRWCENAGIGRKYGKEWRVSRPRLMALLASGS